MIPQQLPLLEVEPAPPLANPYPHPQLWLGTASWSFPGWAGLVYARRETTERLAREGLQAYASHPLMRAVALDRGFYAPIPLITLRGYAASVPADFRFLVKAPRALVRPTSADYLNSDYAARLLIEPAFQGLGSRLGCVHFFFPPGQPADLPGRLGPFLRALPEGVPYSVELRQSSLFDDVYRDALGEGAHAWNVFPGMPSVQPESGCLRVLRWHLGSPGHRPWNLREAARRYLPFSTLRDEDPSTRGRVAARALCWLREGHRVLVLANNKAEGCAPLTLQRLAEEMAVGAREGESRP